MGRRSQVAAIDDAGITVADVSDSPEQLDSFAPQLVSIIDGIGAPAFDLVVRPFHSTIP